MACADPRRLDVKYLTVDAQDLIDYLDVTKNVTELDHIPEKDHDVTPTANLVDVACCRGTCSAKARSLAGVDEGLLLSQIKRMACATASMGSASVCFVQAGCLCVCLGMTAELRRRDTHVLVEGHAKPSGLAVHNTHDHT